MSDEPDRRDWKRIALWLAECHAATAEYDGSLKSTSASRRNRLVSICQRSLNFIDGLDAPSDYPERRVRDRLASVVLKSKEP